MEKIKCCPFCGSEVDFMNLVLPIKMFYCKNHHGCGAVVSFDTPICNRFDKAKKAIYYRLRKSNITFVTVT